MIVLNHNGGGDLAGFEIGPLRETGAESLLVPSLPTFSNVRNGCAVGAQWGDEGKGKVIAAMTEDFDRAHGRKDSCAACIKVNGGANSGHTVYAPNGQKLALNLMPGGVADPHMRFLGLAAGVVADPFKVHFEAEPLEQQGFNIWARLRIDPRCQVSDLTHRLRDRALERLVERGSTARGILPAYEDEAALAAISYAIFSDPRNYDEFRTLMLRRLHKARVRIGEECEVPPEDWHGLFEDIEERELRANRPAIEAGIFKEEHFRVTRYAGADPFTFNDELLIREYWEAGQKLAKHLLPLRGLALGLAREGLVTLYEHGQSIILDKRWGDRPFTTSSNTGPSEIFYSVPLPPNTPLFIMAVAKAYCTAVGTHPSFIARVDTTDPLFQKVGALEKGVTTGRQRDVGHYDAVVTGRSLAISGASGFAVNKLDVLSGLRTLKICFAYQDPDGRWTRDWPSRRQDQLALRPVYHEMPGWNEDISGITSFSRLPRAAQEYLAAIYFHTISAMTRHGSETVAPYPPLSLVGTGPRGEDLIRDAPSPAELLRMTRN